MASPSATDATQTFEGDQKRSLKDPLVRQRRRELLKDPHMTALVDYVAHLRAMGLGEVPDFDPFDGGVDARVLFLFEKPGPMTAERGGSGFISRNNDDPTAAAAFDFMIQSGIPRNETLSWNLIPWWNGTRRITKSELLEGFKALSQLIALLPKLTAVVLVGNKAQRVKLYFSENYPKMKVFTSYHPSPIVRATNPEKWKEIPLEWAKVAAMLEDK
jgi:uracil-DNA glycosylase